LKITALIVILNDHIRGVVSNEETIWSRLVANLPECIGIDLANLKEPVENRLLELKPSIIIQNANLGKLSPYKTISFLQDPLIGMKKFVEPLPRFIRAKIRGRKTFSDIIKKQTESLSGTIKVTNSNFMANMYKKYGTFNIIPMGVDNELFIPMDKKELRRKYNFPMDKKINIFVGSTHAVKGFDKIQRMIQENTSIFWILVLKDVKINAGHNYTVFHKISQDILCELYNCADLCVSRSRVESFGLAMIESMFCGTPVDSTKTGVFWDWQPDNNNPRKEALERGLDKFTWMENWKKFVSNSINN
jgi:glycosyltransferase involved in cell wall biosynthesis